MKDISVYLNYEIEVITETSYKDEETGNFNTYRDSFKKEISGYDLISFIKDKFSDRDFEGLTICKNSLKFDYFNPMSGEGGTDQIIIKELKKYN